MIAYLKSINSPYKSIIGFSGDIDGETESSLNHFPSAYLERLYIFLNHLQNKLGTGEIEMPINILENIDMDSYRLQLETTTNIAMEQGKDLKPSPTEMRGGINDPETDRLSSVIQTFNDRYGTEFTDVDKVKQMAEDIAQEVAKNDKLKNYIKYSDNQNARILICINYILTILNLKRIFQ